MHDIGRTQLEQQTFGEFEVGELEGGEFGEHGDHEGGDRETSEFAEFGEMEEFGGPPAHAEQEEFQTAAELESPFSETEEMELAAELLEVTSEQDLEQFLGDVFRAAGGFVRSDTGRALGGILGDTLRSAAKQALPVVGRALGDAAGGYADFGAKAGTAAGSLLGLELEGLSAEDREFEVARQLVRYAGSAVRHAAAPRRTPPKAAARTAAMRAARAYAPGLLPRLHGRSTQSWPRGGRWIRRGRTIVLYGS
ncbi:MAG TPA: hypothetical protein VGM53_23500 [Streptosporangiaceae bacterium]|jgi:hypothetical protein